MTSPNPTTPEQDKLIQELDVLLTQACLLAGEYQAQTSDLPEIQRTCRVNGQLVCIIACLVPDLPRVSQ